MTHIVVLSCGRVIGPLTEEEARNLKNWIGILDISRVRKLISPKDFTSNIKQYLNYKEETKS